jgi:hypothetical protein
MVHGRRFETHTIFETIVQNRSSGRSGGQQLSSVSRPLLQNVRDAENGTLASDRLFAAVVTNGRFGPDLSLPTEW